MDQHHYEEPDAFVASFNEWDNADRAFPIFVGEYACTTANDGSTNWWTFIQTSCAEAVYMIGMERNSDVVKMAAYAPLLQLFNSTQWAVSIFFHARFDLVEEKP